MDKKITGIVAYITWIGLLVAFIAGDREGAKFHLNQALVIWLAAIVSNIISLIPVVGTLLSLVCSVFLLVCVILGLVSAIKEEEKEVPLIGKIKILK
jgi:uncharacterized membrane protein